MEFENFAAYNVIYSNIRNWLHSTVVLKHDTNWTFTIHQHLIRIKLSTARMIHGFPNGLELELLLHGRLRSTSTCQGVIVCRLNYTRDLEDDDKFPRKFAGYTDYTADAMLFNRLQLSDNETELPHWVHQPVDTNTALWPAPHPRIPIIAQWPHRLTNWPRGHTVLRYFTASIGRVSGNEI